MAAMTAAGQAIGYTQPVAMELLSGCRGDVEARKSRLAMSVGIRGALG